MPRRNNVVSFKRHVAKAMAVSLMNVPTAEYSKYNTYLKFSKISMFCLKIQPSKDKQWLLCICVACTRISKYYVLHNSEIPSKA